MQLCSHCGTQLRSAAKFCYRCGAAVIAPPPTAPYAPPAYPAARPAGGIVLLVAAALIIAVVALAGAFVLFGLPLFLGGNDEEGSSLRVGATKPTPIEQVRATATRAPTTPTPSIPPTPTLPPPATYPAGPVPVLLGVDAPTTARPGDLITVTVRAANQGSAAPGGSISVGLPNDPPLETLPNLPDAPNNSRDVGQEISIVSGCDASKGPALYPLVESYWNDWPAGQEQRVSFSLRVPPVDELRLLIRVSMRVSETNACIRNHPAEFQTPERDQQGLPVFVWRVMVE